MQQEIGFATFNVCNLALPGTCVYANLEPYTQTEYEARVDWIARQIDILDADVIGFQEIFSQAALKDALSRTKKFKTAQHFGFAPEADPQTGRLTPGVAIVSRLPVESGVTAYSHFPRNLSVWLPDAELPVTRFTRPILHAKILVSEQLKINVLVTHLKSKRPDFRADEQENDPYQYGVANLRSMIRRGTEALGLRYLLSDLAFGSNAPAVVLGDFNDAADSVPMQLVRGEGRYATDGFDDRLFDSFQIQAQQVNTGNFHTHSHDGKSETIDHILVTRGFNPACANAIGEVLDVRYFNEHLVAASPEMSDHGMVRTRIRLYGDA